MNVEESLEQLRTMLDQDGYALHWQAAGPQAVDVRIEARADACEDCLVPREVLEAILGDALVCVGTKLGSLELPAGAH